MASIDILEERVDSKKAAKLLGLKNERSVTRLCKAGIIAPAFKVAETWQIPLSTIAAYLESCSNATS